MSISENGEEFELIMSEVSAKASPELFYEEYLRKHNEAVREAASIVAYRTFHNNDDRLVNLYLNYDIFVKHLEGLVSRFEGRIGASAKARELLRQYSHIILGNAVTIQPRGDSAVLSQTFRQWLKLVETLNEMLSGEVDAYLDVLSDLTISYEKLILV